MVTLKCDVCGGSLIMQPGATAKCGSCGMDYSTQMLSEKFAKQNTPEINNIEKDSSDTQNSNTNSLGASLVTSNEEPELIVETEIWQDEPQSLQQESDYVAPLSDYNDDSQRIFIDEDDSESITVTNDNGNNTTKVMAWIVIGIIAVLTIVLIAVSQSKKNDDVYEPSYDTDNGQTTSSENNDYKESYNNSSVIEVPTWYTVNGVAVNGNELCFSRDDGLIMGEGEEPLTVTHYVFSNDGMNLYSMKEYIIFQNEDAASKYAEELNTYGDDGRNNFGMHKDEAQYYSEGNILVEEFLPQYTNQTVNSLEGLISMYEEYGWTIDYISSDITGSYGNNTGSDYVSWTNKDVCDYSYSDYTFLMDSSAYEIITPTFEVYSSSIFVSTALEFEGAGNYYTDKSRYFNVELYDASNDTLVNYYTGMYDNVEGGVDFSTERNHSYYLKISTYVESGEKTHGHGHIYLD